ncbi:MAG: hypothetical protein V4487_08785 [Chlamydiota bacterium]
MLLIHKDNFRKTVIEHREIFESVLGKKIDVNQMLKSFELDNDPVKSVLKDNHFLIGILHGFGVHNSKNFLVRLEQMEKSIDQFKSQLEMDESLGIQPMEALEKENHPVLNLPVFAVDPTDPETGALRRKYKRERGEILKKFEGRDPLEVVMEEWELHSVNELL